MHRWLPVACLALVCACGTRRRDTVVPDVCHTPSPEWDAPIDAAAIQTARHVVRGRVRWTGSILDEDAENKTGHRQELTYVIVDILEFHRGDAWTVTPRMQRAFPLLGKTTLLEKLHCREEEAFFFALDLPTPSSPPREGGVPDPVVRAFTPQEVTLHAIVPESAADALRAILAPGR